MTQLSLLRDRPSFSDGPPIWDEQKYGPLTFCDHFDCKELALFGFGFQRDEDGKAIEVPRPATAFAKDLTDLQKAERSRLIHCIKHRREGELLLRDLRTQQLMLGHLMDLVDFTRVQRELDQIKEQAQNSQTMEPGLTIVPDEGVPLLRLDEKPIPDFNSQIWSQVLSYNAPEQPSAPPATSCHEPVDDDCPF
jgi:hypothetical protein